MPVITAAAADEQIIEEVPALNVRFVFVPKFVGEGPVNVTVLLPKFTVRVLVLLELTPAAVTLKLFVVNVPCVKTILSVTFTASPSVTVIPDPLIATEPPNVLPALVSVPVPFSVKAPL